MSLSSLSHSHSLTQNLSLSHTVNRKKKNPKQLFGLTSWVYNLIFILMRILSSEGEGRGIERDRTRKRKTDGGRNCLSPVIFRITHPWVIDH